MLLAKVQRAVSVKEYGSLAERQFEWIVSDSNTFTSATQTLDGTSLIDGQASAGFK